MPQFDSYCIDFMQPADTFSTNAILLLLGAANQGVWRQSLRSSTARAPSIAATCHSLKQSHSGTV